MKRAVGHYLARHAEPEAALAERIEGRFRAAVVMPACGEPAASIDGLAACEGALAIVVVNARDDHDAATHEHNLALIAAHADGEIAPGAWLGCAGGVTLVLIDRATAGRRLPARQGVGLARKIGCDLALGLRARGQLDSRFLHWADADAELPAGYLDAVEAAPAASVLLTYPFEHVPSGDAAVDEAHAAYECYLRYYRLGLAAARSPYAHHTIGSTLAFDAETYAAVRGVPRLLAAEDFYAVDKAAKLGAVWTPEGEPIRIRARRSGRVPFGTGRATADITCGAAEGRAYCVPDPRTFALLGACLAALDAGLSAHDPRAARAALLALDQADRRLLDGALTSLGAFEALAAALGDRSAKSPRTRLHAWFDGFRTLKLLHALRDGGLPDRPWREALAAAPFLDGLDVGGTAEDIRRLLAQKDHAGIEEHAAILERNRAGDFSPGGAGGCPSRMAD